jgi:hypothetical protein
LILIRGLLIQKSLAPLRVRGHFGRQEPDRCLTFQLRVFSQENFAHSARAEFGGNALAANGFADHAVYVLSLST